MTPVSSQHSPTANHIAITLERLEMPNGLVVLEHGPAGVMGRIDSALDGFSRTYGGPLDEATVEAFREVALTREVLVP